MKTKFVSLFLTLFVTTTFADPVRLGSIGFGKLVYPENLTNQLASVAFSGNLEDLVGADSLADRLWVGTNYLSVGYWNSTLAPAIDTKYLDLNDVLVESNIVKRAHLVPTTSFDAHLVDEGSRITVEQWDLETGEARIVVFDDTSSNSSTNTYSETSVALEFVPEDNVTLAKVELQADVYSVMIQQSKTAEGNIRVRFTTEMLPPGIDRRPKCIITNCLVYAYANDFAEPVYDLRYGSVEFIDSLGTIDLCDLRKWVTSTYDPATRGHWSEFQALSDANLGGHDLVFDSEGDIRFRSGYDPVSEFKTLTLATGSDAIMRVRMATATSVTNQVNTTNEVSTLATVLEDLPEPTLNQLQILAFKLGIDNTATTVTCTNVGANNYDILVSPTLDGSYIKIPVLEQTYDVVDGTNVVNLAFYSGQVSNRAEFYKVRARYMPEVRAASVKAGYTTTSFVELDSVPYEVSRTEYPALVEFDTEVYVKDSPVITEAAFADFISGKNSITVEGHTYGFVDLTIDGTTYKVLGEVE